MRDSTTDRVRFVRERYCSGDNRMFAERIGMSEVQASNICNKTNIGSKVAESISKAFPQVSVRWLLHGDGEMEGYQASASERKVITKRYVMPDDSMSPSIVKGDMLTVQQCPESHVIMGGYLYFLSTKYNGEFVRYLYDDGDVIRCHCTSGAYSDFSIPKSDITSVCKPIRLERSMQ